MYKIVRDGKEYYSDTILYVKKAENGCFVPCNPEDADFIVGKVPDDTVFEGTGVETLDGGAALAYMKAALQTLGVETEEKEETSNAE